MQRDVLVHFPPVLVISSSELGRSYGNPKKYPVNAMQFSGLLKAKRRLAGDGKVYDAIASSCAGDASGTRRPPK